MTRTFKTMTTIAFAIGILAAGATSALAAKPVTEHQGKESVTFFDDFIFELCGIRTMTTVNENWTLTTYADGSQRFTDSRKFVPADKRIPIEYGAGMSTFDVNGVQTVHGSPLRLRSQQGGGIVLLDAGSVRFGDDITMHGPHPSLGLDLTPYYCP
jgi:hypothetical protein